jgi:hypothetical protein
MMFRKNRITGALGLLAGMMTASAGMMIASDAEARVCLLRSTSGQCVFWSGSVECENLGTGGAGAEDKSSFGRSVAAARAMGCAVSSLDEESAGITGIAFCADKDGKSVTPVEAALAAGFGGEAEIQPGNRDGKGAVFGLNVRARAAGEQLRELDQYCGGEGLSAVDFVPCQMTAKVRLVGDRNSVLDGAEFACHLPQCETLAWDPETGRPERREYECSEK